MLTVTRDASGKSGFCTLAVDHIIFMEGISEKKLVIFHTLDEIYYSMGTLKYWEVALNNSGFKFELVHRDLCVNLNNVQLLDKARKNIYFEREVKKTSKKCPIATQRFNDFLSLVIIHNPQIVII
ncbi:MAG: LytTR family transcriptional regulator DNA-binding domain-containing protein [Bacillota bacterium]